MNLSLYINISVIDPRVGFAWIIYRTSETTPPKCLPETTILIGHRL